MTITTTLKKFEELKAAILKDGVVDYDEAVVLLDFIAPYARAGNKMFMNLHKSIVKAQIDGVISKDESDKIVDEIDNVSEFLKREKKIEIALVWISGIALVAFAIYHLI